MSMTLFAVPVSRTDLAWRSGARYIYIYMCVQNQTANKPTVEPTERTMIKSRFDKHTVKIIRGCVGGGLFVVVVVERKRQGTGTIQPNSSVCTNLAIIKLI